MANEVTKLVSNATKQTSAEPSSMVGDGLPHNKSGSTPHSYTNSKVGHRFDSALPRLSAGIATNLLNLLLLLLNLLNISC